MCIDRIAGHIFGGNVKISGSIGFVVIIWFRIEKGRRSVGGGMRTRWTLREGDWRRLGQTRRRGEDVENIKITRKLVLNVY